ncbi:Magnesium and cobalt efflux protein CorC [Candidatus Palibaumannia cicadellinicola]|uniref:Magnesium and cobalt efflux protein CorC n=2 Tax=Candidatus Palibaumannia cicadellinicola TaxID=186490 RepID=A0A088MYL4_9GAMM|nr:Magnesium and cobalt efflux protein CorC [Candidatus Baumannia cicadellinicola]
MLEIILGIDNLVFVAVLADKLSPKKRDSARIIGLVLALVIRLVLLSFISWIVTLTWPLFRIMSLSFSGRDLILLLGGFFLLFKATTELHERLENKEQHSNASRGYASFCTIVVQIVALDAVFSLDSVMTAVGIVNNLTVTITAVVIAMAIMILVSKFLTHFVNTNHTVVVLCLSFLLMISVSLIAEGLGVHVNKKYLYTAIGFSILIEILNQIAWRNLMKHQSSKPLRDRTSEAIMLLMGGRTQSQPSVNEENFVSSLQSANFAETEYCMITNVLSLASRNLRSIMTPRNQISWLNSKLPIEELQIKLMNTQHNMLPLCYGKLDHLIGIVHTKDCMSAIADGEHMKAYEVVNPAIVVLDTLDVLNCLTELRRAKGSLVIVSNELGVIQGLITPLDILEAITGKLTSEDLEDTLDIKISNEGWLAKGSTNISTLQNVLNTQNLVRHHSKITSLAGLLMSQCNHMPVEGEVLIIHQWRFTIRQMIEYRIEQVWIERISPNTQKLA